MAKREDTASARHVAHAIEPCEVTRYRQRTAMQCVVKDKGADLMPAKSAAQQKAAGAALSAKRGDQPESKLKGAARSMEQSMTEQQLEELAHTKRKGKPEHDGKG